MADLRSIDFSQKHFECGGRKFYVKDSLSFARYRELQKLNYEFGYSATYLDLFVNIRKAMQFMDKLQFVDTAVTLHNILLGIANLDEKDDPALRMCALFIDEDGEDATVYDEGKMREKIECWGKELSVLPFFQLAVSLVPGWLPSYKIVLNDGSEQKSEESTP